jgi:hypothetical protein
MTATAEAAMRVATNAPFSGLSMAITRLWGNFLDSFRYPGE